MWGGTCWESLRPVDPDTSVSPAAELTIAVSPGMAPTFNNLVEQFNAQTNTTPDGSLVLVRTVTMVPEKMVESSLEAPAVPGCSTGQQFVVKSDRPAVGAPAADDYPGPG